MIGLWIALAFGQDDDVPSHEAVVDSTAYVTALVERFSACLAAEGTVITAPDAEAVKEAVTTMAPVMAFEGGTSGCTASAEAVAACAATVQAMSCSTLQKGIEDVVNGIITTPGTPSWAVDYADAMVGRIGACYTAETGLGLTASEQGDLTLFRNTVAGTMGSLSQTCPVVTDWLATCEAEVASLDCGKLAAYIASEEVDLMVKDFMATCEGLLDCGEE